MSEAHLTSPHDNRMQTLQAQTAPGQAHWAGTGPEATYCTTCRLAHWNGYYKKKNSTGVLKPIQCDKYRQLMNGAAPKFEHSHRSCRFYEEGGAPPKKEG